MKHWALWFAQLLDAVRGRTRKEWDAAPVIGVQVLMVGGLDPDVDKSRVGWHADDEYMSAMSPSSGAWKGFNFYAWIQGDGPSGVTPDCVLDLWFQKTRDGGVTIGDLSLDDFHSIGVKLARSIPNNEFKEILERASSDPAFS